MIDFSSFPDLPYDLRTMCQGPTIWIHWLNDADGVMPGRYETVPWENGIWVHDRLAALGFVEARVCKDESQEENGRTHPFLTPRGRRVLHGALTICDFDKPIEVGLNNILHAIGRMDLKRDTTAIALFEVCQSLTRLQRIDILLKMIQLPRP